ncbi:alpha/beta hydrolase family protein [Cephaloticoccus primus]|uniref:alpha/beta hydrolase family protein n=1 Tax=Cephaloticoccus primus TaxID=1548207 RepID=UPI0018D36683|nr:prolyl oligopeptidase family serine peptidase [Cephaloticoccus primus]
MARWRAAAALPPIAALALGLALAAPPTSAQPPPLPPPLAQAAGAAAPDTAQKKRPLAWADFESWRSISSPTLSPDGRWLAYGFMPARGDGEIVVRQLPDPASPAGKSLRSYRLNAGETPPPAFPQGVSASGRPPPPRSVEHLFTGDSRFLISLIFPSAQTQREARMREPRSIDLLRAQATSPRKLRQPMILVDLEAGHSELVPEVQSVQASLGGGAWIAYLHEPVMAELPPSRTSAPPFSRVPAPSGAAKGTLRPPPENRRLVLRELLTGPLRGRGAAKQVGGKGQQRTFDYVTEYSLSRDARTLLYLVDSPRQNRNGLYAYAPGGAGEPQHLFRTAKTGAARLSKLTWDARQAQAAFLVKYQDGRHEVGLWKLGERAPTMVLAAATPGLPHTMQIGEHSSLEFSADGRKLYVGLVPKPAADGKAPDARSPRGTSNAAAASDPNADPLEQAFPELWSWDDGLIAPRRSVLSEVERTRSYPGVLDLETLRFVPIGSTRFSELRFSEDGLWALAFDEGPYLRLRDYDATYADVYAVDTTSGARRLVAKKLRGLSGDEELPSLYFSPKAGPQQYVAYFDAGHWWAVDLASGDSRNLSAGLPVSFAYEEHDKLEPAPPYGWGGWLADGRSFIVYDRYDLWQLSVAAPLSAEEEQEEWESRPPPPAPRNLTAGFGRKEQIVLRLQDVAPQQGHSETEPEPRAPLWLRGIDPAEPLILRGEDERTRDSGFFRQAILPHSAPAGQADAPPPQRLLWGEKNYRYLDAARRPAPAGSATANAGPGRSHSRDVLLFSASRFDEFPDLWVSDGHFTAPQRVSDGRAQLAPLDWGSPPEIIDYTGPAGAPLKALLYKPPHFDPSQRYPLIVYLYERLSPLRHAFFAPSYSANINIPHYVSNGYLVYLVDIAYEIGAPGPSALDSVHAALDAVSARSFVDPARVGIQGSSWGGYQAAYIVTQSDRFRAAVAGSPVGNMTSAYAGIRWRSGRARLFQYEQSQSRLGAALTAAPERYLANSPVAHAHTLHTPLLLMHNDGDGVVPWNQSTELFLTLRRHEKPVWLVNYPHETHEVVRYANRRDFQKRMWDFFEHHLHGAPAPEWMKPAG